MSIIEAVEGLHIVFVIIGLKLRNERIFSAEIRRDVIELPLLDILDVDRDFGARQDGEFVRLFEKSILPLDEGDTTIPIVVDKL